jgi:ketosteroid isomerase-like protein
MASANLALVRSIFASWERGDYSAAEWADPEIEFTVADGPAPASQTGLAAMAEAYRRFLSTWEDFRTEAEEFREIDDERVLVCVRDRGRGKASGMEIGQIMGTEDGAILFVIREAKVVKLVNYWNRERALAELGLAPETSTAERPR